MAMEGKTALVTGGSGFLGSHLCDELISRGLSVICMDNLITGDKKNIEHLLDNKKFVFCHHNVSEKIALGRKVEYVLHFASPASPIDYIKYPIQTLKVGALGTHNSLGVAKDCGAVFLLASTSEVYGDPLESPQNEEYWGNVNPIGPRGVYDEAKRFAEAMTMAYHRAHGLDTKIVRIFNTYGARMRMHDGRVVPEFISQILRGRDLTVCGDGSQTRSFCYVSDLIDGIVKLLFSNINDPVNIGNDEELSILDFAGKICDVAGSKAKITYTPLPVDDPKIRRPDIRRARSLLGWEPKVSLEDGLRRTLEWFKNNDRD